MKIGMMNNPSKPIESEIQFASENQFDFLDLTMEPPRGLVPAARAKAVAEMLKNANLTTVGHTAYYLPLDSPFDKVRHGAVLEVIEQLDAFEIIGTQAVTLHAGFSYPHRFFSFDNKLQFWKRTMDTLIPEAHKRNITLMVENMAGHKDHFRILRDLLKHYPELGLHLDVGHANLDNPTNHLSSYLKRFKKRLMHIHLSDNFSRGDDLHLPLGAGGIPWKQIIKMIKGTRYDGTFTLEVFSKERDYLILSRQFLRNLWLEN